VTSEKDWIFSNTTHENLKTSLLVTYRSHFSFYISVRCQLQTRHINLLLRLIQPSLATPGHSATHSCPFFSSLSVVLHTLSALKWLPSVHQMKQSPAPLSRPAGKHRLRRKTVFHTLNTRRSNTTASFITQMSAKRLAALRHMPPQNPETAPTNRRLLGQHCPSRHGD
jgi:hypothetical protein